jgi:hypothetical protein
MTGHVAVQPPTRLRVIWLIPAVLGLIGLVTIGEWLPDPLASYPTEQARVIDAEGDVACQNFVTTTDQLMRCSSEIKLLRQRDRDRRLFI